MSGTPRSFQRRTDDLYLLKTRNLVFENVDGTFPVEGALAYTTNNGGAVGFSTVTADAAGNLTIPGNTIMGPNGGYVTVDGGTGLLTANQDVDVYGKLSVYNNAEVNALNLVNTNNINVISQLDDRTISGVETLTWSNAAGISEPISGWNAKLTPLPQPPLQPFIFRTVDISGLTGATLIMAQNQNALLTLFQQRGIFLTTLTADPTLAAVFNTTVSAKFIITSSSNISANFIYSIPGNSAAALSYTSIVSAINSAATRAVSGTSLSFVASYNAGTIRFTVGPNTTFTIVDTETNGTAQLLLNHIGTTILKNTVYTDVSTVVKDFTVVMPSTPATAPTIADGSPDVSDCIINIPTLPVTTPIAIQNVGIYWCLSGSAFSTSPNAIIPASQTTYRITDLAAGGTYIVALSYRSLYDESPRGPLLTFTTKLRNSVMATMSSNINVYSVEVTEDVNWLFTPSYGTSIIKYDKPYLSNVKFTVASVFSAIWKDTLNDLTNISQIQSISFDIYAGATTSTTGARFYTGTNPLTNILYASSDTVEAKYGDKVGLGSSISIYSDTDGIDMLRKIFNADDDGNIGVGKNMVFGWYCTQGGLRNCEMTRLNVIYTV